MKSKMGEKSVQIAKRNRAKIIATLLQNPMTFSQLQKELKVSPRTLSLHLQALLKEGLAKREIEGKYIVYKAIKPKSILELRKQFFLELSNSDIYESALNEKTRRLYYEFLNALGESIEKPEPEAETEKVMVKTIEIPNGFKGTVKQSITNLYEKPELKESKPKKLYSFSRKKRKVNRHEG
jgi:DNA-binding transcriptional ArsR family regulator